MLSKSEFLKRLREAALSYNDVGRSWIDGVLRQKTKEEKLLDACTSLGLPLSANCNGPIVQIIEDFPFGSLGFQELQKIEAAWEVYQGIY
jgi:hypothetical protein